ncbi:hypothetical protein BCV69DRAFT_263561, partial [Microstroma glucosiphilum]
RAARGVALQSASGRTVALSPRGFATSSSSRAEEKDPQLGDYPDVPAKSYQSRRYDKSWWDPQEKRNFGEIPGEQDDVLSVWAPDIHAGVKPSFALRQLGIATLGFCSFFSVVYYFAADSPAERRTYPRDGLAEELGNSQVAAYKEGDFDAKEEDEDEDD